MREARFVAIFGRYLKDAMNSAQTDFDKDAVFNSFLSQIDEVFESVEEFSDGDEKNLTNSLLEYCSGLFNKEVSELDWDSIIERLS